MAIVMQIIIEQDDTGVGTRIVAEGPCTEAEATMRSLFINQSLLPWKVGKALSAMIAIFIK